jgi:mono/diheme cytochrome c family protein
MTEAGSIKMWVLAFVLLAGAGFGALVGIGCAIGANACPFTKQTAQTSTDGRTLYLANCALCHGINGEGTKNAPSLRSGEGGTLDLAAVEKKIEKGRPFFGMPAFSKSLKGPFTDQQIQAVAKYVLTLRSNP